MATHSTRKVISKRVNGKVRRFAVGPLSRTQMACKEIVNKKTGKTCGKRSGGPRFAYRCDDHRQPGIGFGKAKKSREKSART